MPKLRATVTYKTELDTDPDLSWLGTWSNTPESEASIEHEPGNSRTYNWFNPQPGLEEYAARDYERMLAYNRGHWWMEGHIVRVECGGVVAEASVWGVESDATDSDREEIRRSLRSEAFHEWREKVARLRETWCREGVAA